MYLSALPLRLGAQHLVTKYEGATAIITAAMTATNSHKRKW